MPIAKRPVTPRMKRKSASTSPATDEACSGARGNAGFIVLRVSRPAVLAAGDAASSP